MEITAVPFLYQDDYYSSHFFSPTYPELDHNNLNNSFIPSPPLKKRKTDNSTKNGGNDGGVDNLMRESTAEVTLKQILASCLFLEGEDKKEELQNWSASTQHQQQQYKTESMKHFYDDPLEYGYGGYPQLELVADKEEEVSNHHHLANEDLRNNNNNKRARTSSPTTSLPAAATIEENQHENSSTAQNQKNKEHATAPHRRLWVKDRSKAWWEECNSPDFPDSEFKKAFRMSKSTFNTICNELDSAITKKDTMLRAAIPVKQRVAVCIWRLATGAPLRLVSKKFGLGISTCHKLVLEVCTAIKSVLMPKYLQWPDEQRMRTVKRQFESISGIPDIGGSMYTTHIPIIAPKISVAAYFNKRHTDRNQKTSYSITVQGVVDHKGIFTDVCIGYPGSMTDDQILEQSALYKRANRSLLRDVRVVGTSGYPLLDWVLVPYTHQNLTWAQHGFNEKIGEVQKAAKDAFARLKGRWSCLQKRTEVKLQDLPVVLGACCVLHNICEIYEEGIDEGLDLELFDDEIVPENSLRSHSSVQVRDHIAHNLLHHGGLGNL